MSVDRKSIIIGVSLFLFTLAWAYFLNELAIIPDQLLTGVGQIALLTKLITIPFVGFAFFLSLTLGIISAYSNKDERNKVYVTTIVPSLLAAIMGAILFQNYSQWYPLAIFYFGAIPFMIEYSRIKKIELQNFVSIRSNYSATKRGLQIIGVGVLVTLALFALPQQDLLYKGFEEALFSGEIISNLDVEEASVDFLISTQKNILTQITELKSYQALTQKDDTDAQSFTKTIEATLTAIDAPEYRKQAASELKEQQQKLDTTQILIQVEKTIPGFGLVRDYYWMIASIVGSLLFFILSTLLLAPLGGILGTIVEKIIPADTIGTNQNGKPSERNKKSEDTGATDPSVFYGDSKPATPIAQTPTYEHKEETPANTDTASTPSWGNNSSNSNSAKKEDTSGW